MFTILSAVILIHHVTVSWLVTGLKVVEASGKMLEVALTVSDLPEGCVAGWVVF